MTTEIKTTAELAETEAMPQVHVAHTDPDAQKGCGDLAVPQAVATKPVAQKSPARWAYERVILYIKNFEAQLETSQEVAMGFAGADAGVLRIEGVGYYDPDIITFYGSDATGARTQLVQHVSQLNVLLRALPKAVDDEAPRRIGFRLAEDLEEGE
ncbi:MAG: DUF6173 family protein [Pseudomonadota bacterium]